MNADLSLVEQSDSSACPARSSQNVPVRPAIAQSTHSFFCTFLRISQKISISQRLRAGCSLATEGIGGQSQEKEGSRFCTEVAVGELIGRLRFVLSSCSRLRLTNRWPIPQEPYRQEPFLLDEDRIGGSAIPSMHHSRLAQRHTRVLTNSPPIRHTPQLQIFLRTHTKRHTPNPSAPLRRISALGLVHVGCGTCRQHRRRHYCTHSYLGGGDNAHTRSRRCPLTPIVE